MRVSKQASCPGPSVFKDAGGGSTGLESFVTVNDDSATLPNSRQLTGGTNIGIVDGGAGSPVTVNFTGAIPDRVEQDNCINAAHFVPAQSPFSPAPIENYYIAASGFAGKVVRYDPGETTAASCFWSNRWVTRPVSGSYTVDCQLNFFTDNASTNNFKFCVYHKSGSFPSFDLSTAPTGLTPSTYAGLGAYRQGRALFTFNTLGDNFQIFVERQGGDAADTNPGTVYLQSILLYFNAALS